MALGWCCLRRQITYSARTRLLACAVLVSYLTYYVRDHVVWHLQSYLRDAGPPPDVDKILLWDGDPIENGDPAWQRADDSGQVFVYAAHYDDVGSSPLIRVIAVALDPLPYFYVTCRYFSRLEGLEVRNVTGDLKHNRARNGRTYISAFIECPLSKFDNFLPYAVAVDKGNNRLGHNYMIIHYSWADTPTIVNNSTRLSLSWSSRIAADDGRGGAFAWNVTRCFPPFQLGFDDHIMLAEAVVFSRLLGVERFFFYVKDAGPRVLAMLKVLEAQGDTVVLPWNIYTEDKELYYAGQYPAINDCLYRHLRSSRFLLFGDVDELFVPRDHSSLTNLLHTQFTQNPECGAFLFLNVFFNLLLPPTNLPSTTAAAYNDGDDALYHQVGDEDEGETTSVRKQGQPSSQRSLLLYKMLTHTRRHLEILSPGDRSKPAVDPRRVLAGSVHVVEALRPGFESCVMEESLGLLHHYREFPDYLPPESEQTEDFFLWDYFDSAVVELDFVMQEYEKLSGDDNQYTLNMFRNGRVYS